MSTQHTSKIFNTHPNLDITKSPQDPIRAVSYNDNQYYHDIEENPIFVAVNENANYNPEISKFDQDPIAVVRYEKQQPKYDIPENHTIDLSTTATSAIHILTDNSQQNIKSEIVVDKHMDDFKVNQIRTHMPEDNQQSYSLNMYNDVDDVRKDDKIITVDLDEQPTQSLLDTIRPIEIFQNTIKEQNHDDITVNENIEERNDHVRIDSTEELTLFERQAKNVSTHEKENQQYLDNNGNLKSHRIDDVKRVDNLLNLPKQPMDHSIESSRYSLDSTDSSLVLSDATTVRTAKKLSVQFVNYSSQSSDSEINMKRTQSRLSQHSLASSDTKSDNLDIVGMNRRMSDHSIVYSSDGEVTRASSVLSFASADSDTNHKMASRISNQSETSASDVEIGNALRTSDRSIAYSSTSTDGEMKSTRRASDNTIVYSSDGLSRSASRVSNYSAQSSTNEADIGLARRISNASSTATLTDEETIQSATQMSHHSEASSKLETAW